MKFLIFYFVLFFQLVNAQYQEATLYFIDGDSLFGYGTLKGEKIKFRVSKDDKADVWDHNMVKGITFHGYDFDVKFVYLKVNKNAFYDLYEVLEEGSVTLYTDTRELSNNLNSPNGYGMLDLSLFFNRKKRVVNNKILDEIENKPKTVSIYVKRDNEEYPTSLNFKFRKKVLEYFAGCSKIEEKVNSGEWFSNNILEIVTFYNDICAE